MSTFCGIMNELDYISVDNFTGKNLNSYAYFLSHCHIDHMRGLDFFSFKQTLVNNNAYLYLSAVSKAILEKKYPHLTERLKTLHKSGKNYIDIPKINKTLAVTLIPAGHCPGSVMFLFESDKTLLYTGDIRIYVNELQKYKELYDLTGNVKKIDNIYLDTTFFLKAYTYFPQREESIDAFCKLINDWLAKDKNNVVFIITPAAFGSEYLFMEIYKRCRQCIHVAENKYKVYINIPELEDVVTLDGKTTRIHNECLGKYNFCLNVDKCNIFKIKPSALSWKHLNSKMEIIKQLPNNPNVTHVCYSSHSSYTEIINILKFLKPLQITPCVRQEEDNNNEEMENTIKEILLEIHGSDESDEEEIGKFENKLSWVNISATENCDGGEQCDFFSILD